MNVLHILLLILIIFIAYKLCFLLLAIIGVELSKNIFDRKSTMLGGKEFNPNAIINKPIFYKNYIIDSQNLMHNLFTKINGKGRMRQMDYFTYMDKISNSLLSSLPKKNINIVTKNYEDGPPNIQGENISNENLLKYQSIKNIYENSKLHKNIIYHLAFDPHEQDYSKHYAVARDDLLCIYVAEKQKDYSDTCLITLDRMKDHRDFSRVKPFYYFTIREGKIKHEGLVDPSYISNLPPNNLFEYQFVKNKKLAGKIYEHNDLKKCLYLTY